MCRRRAQSEQCTERLVPNELLEHGEALADHTFRALIEIFAGHFSNHDLHGLSDVVRIDTAEPELEDSILDFS